MADGGFLTKHGFPRGYRFVPTPLELVSLLSGKIHGGGKLLPPLDSIFHDVPILHYHPEELYDMYKDDAEHRYIYFFSVRQFQKQQGAGGGAIPEEKDQKEPRPVRMAKGGGWRPSGSGQVLARSKGGFVAGRMVTMVFYDGGRDKSSWGMHEFVVPVDDTLSSLSPIPKHTRFYDLALYRLYILRSGDIESENSGAGSSSHQMLPNAYDHFLAASTAVAPCPPPPLQPWGIFAAAASTSLMPPPPPQHPGVQHAHHYSDQAAFGAAVHGGGSPDDSCQFASSPAPAPPAAVDTAAHQAPATATHDADEQEEAGDFGATRSPCSPAAAEEEHATTMAEPAHAQSADCVKPMEEEAPPPPLEGIVQAAEDEDDDYHGPGMPDWNLGFEVFNHHSFQFTMDDILRDTAFDEPPAMEGDGNSGGGNCSQGGGAKQEPPAALGCY
ncbi:unnamed protein product [Urochloa decumbens]|uniref:NAC domain-containing protein n=1 Tax=Urochloa decumbens TaxID=240449 RepID=A0ABC8ZF47_9POAL